MLKADKLSWLDSLTISLSRKQLANWTHTHTYTTHKMLVRQNLSTAKCDTMSELVITSTLELGSMCGNSCHTFIPNVLHFPFHPPFSFSCGWIKCVSRFIAILCPSLHLQPAHFKQQARVHTALIN